MKVKVELDVNVAEAALAYLEYQTADNKTSRNALKAAEAIRDALDDVEETDDEEEEDKLRLFRYTVTKELVIAAHDEDEAYDLIEDADDETMGVYSDGEEILKADDLPYCWDEDMYPFNGSLTIKEILES